MRVKSKVWYGNAVCWNGRNVDEVRAVTGELFVGMHSNYVLVRHSSGEVIWVREGWWVVRSDGADDIRVLSGNAFSDHVEVVTENATT